MSGVTHRILFFCLASTILGSVSAPLVRAESVHGDSTIILATGGRTCQIGPAMLDEGVVYFSTSSAVSCMNGSIYLNRDDGLIDIELPGRRLLLWVWGTPLAMSQDGVFVELPEAPWFWQDSQFFVSADAMEALLNQGVALSVAPAALPRRLRPARQYRTDLRTLGKYNGLRVYIDPGHGGDDLGAVDAQGMREKDVVLSVSLKLARLLEEQGYEVKLSRENDRYPTLSERVEEANAWNADLMLSLHCNSAPRKTARGVETYVLSRQASDPRALALARFENAYEATLDGRQDLVEQLLGDVARHAQENASNRLATVFQRTLIEHLQAEDRGVRKAPFFVLAGTTMPAFLVELGFLSNAEEAELLRQNVYQARLARSVLEGVEQIRHFLQLRAGQDFLEEGGALP